MTKRRLPVLQAPSGAAPDEGPPRPVWQWVAFGAAAIIAAWVPLSTVAAAIGARFVQRAGGVMSVRAALTCDLVYAVGLGLGAVAGGYCLGRWGGPGATVRVAAQSGLAAAAVLAILTGVSLRSPAGLVGLVPLGVLTPAMAAAGARLGARTRSRT